MANRTDLNIEQLKDIIRHSIKNNEYLQGRGFVPCTLNVEGDAGLGKTSAIVQVTQELGIQFVRRNLAEIEELGDLVGFPIKQFEVCLGADKCEWIVDSGVGQYLNTGWILTGRSRMSYAPPEWIVNVDETRGGILLLDDYTRADERFMQACMSLIETQKYLSWSLPKGWTILLSTNPDDGNYQVTSLDDAQKTRFSTLNLKFDINCWAKWAEEQHLDNRCINFLLMHPELVTTKTNPRSITTFFNSISSIQSFEENLPLIQILGEGSVGQEFATLFTLFINNRLDKLMSPDEMLFGDDEERVINILRRAIGSNNNYRADIASTLATRMVNYSIWYAKDHTVERSLIDRIAAVVLSDVFSVDLRYNIISRIHAGNKVKFKLIMLNKDLIKYAMA